MIKAKYIDDNGFEYKSKRSKNSEVKRSFIAPVLVKSNPVVETSTHITYKNDKYSVVYNKSTKVLSIGRVGSKALNKYGKEVVVPVLNEVVESVNAENIASFIWGK